MAKGIIAGGSGSGGAVNPTAGIPRKVAVRLLASGWDAENSQIVDVLSLSADKNAQLVHVLPDNAELYTDSGIVASVAEAGKMKFTAETVPEVDLDVMVVLEELLAYNPDNPAELLELHASTHATGGADEIKPEDISAAPAVHEHDAEDVTSGTFAADRIPALDTSKITSGTFAADRIPNLPASKITSGTLPVERGGTGNTGVDTTPTSGSTKMVTSGGVYTAVSGKAAKPSFVTATMNASGWSGKTYSFESIYPNASNDISIEVAPTATAEQFEAFGAAMICGSHDSNIATAIGDVPTVNIPIIIKVVAK